MAPTNSLTIADVRIFTGDTFIPHGHVVVTDGKISAVGSGAPPAANDDDGERAVLSKPNHTLLPGFIDCHVHADRGKMDAVEQSLRFGVTTVCDMHNEHKHVQKLLAATQDPKNTNIYADYKTCGVAATIPGGWPEPVVLAHDSSEETLERIATEWAKLNSPDDAAAYVEAQIAQGASYIKLMHEDGHSLNHKFTLPSRELQAAVISAAHARGLIAVAHALSYNGTREILECGADGLAHTFLDQPIQAELIELYKARRAHCNPTLGCLGSLTTESEPLQRKFADDPLAQQLLLKNGARESYLQSMGMAKGSGTLENALDSVRVLHESGVPIIVGSDAAGPALGTTYGLSFHQELHMLCCEVGMEPVEVLKSATGVPARRFGFDDRGFIEKGKKADLVLCEGDVEDFMKKKGLCLPIKGVWRDGVVAEVWQDIMS